MRKEKTDENELLQIGIMGGTFDPIHYGHLVAAEAVRDKFNLQKVIFVPAGNPPHKKEKNLSNKMHRYLMTLLATASNTFFEVSTNETDKQGYTYTVDTIKQFHQQFNGKAKFYFITGADALNEILTWKDVDCLFKICEFVAATRPGFKHEQLLDNIQYLTKKYDGKIHFVEIPSLAISSTDIRLKVANDISVKYLLPEVVETYIYKNGLYSNQLNS